MWLPKRFRFLAEDEIAGAGTINPIVEFIRGIRSTDDFIMLNPNANNSMNIDLDLDALREWLFRAYPHPELKHSFKAEIIDGNKIKISSGSVYFPNAKASISAMSQTSCNSNYMAYVRLTNETTGQIIYDNAITHTLQTGNNDYRVCLPICRTYKDANDVWQVQYYNVGDFAFVEEPYFWVSGYNKSKTQFLMHQSGNNWTEWIDAGDCEEE